MAAAGSLAVTVRKGFTASTADSQRPSRVMTAIGVALLLAPIEFLLAYVGARIRHRANDRGRRTRRANRDADGHGH